MEKLMPHAIQIRQIGGPEVLTWTPVRRLARELKQQDLGDLAGKQIHKRRRASRLIPARRAIGIAPATALRS